MKVTIPLSEINKRISKKHVIISEPDFDTNSGNFIVMLVSLQSTISDNTRMFLVDPFDDGGPTITGEGYIFGLGDKVSLHLTSSELIRKIKAQGGRDISSYIEQESAENEGNDLVYLHHNGTGLNKEQMRALKLK